MNPADTTKIAHPSFVALRATCYWPAAIAVLCFSLDGLGSYARAAATRPRTFGVKGSF